MSAPDFNGCAAHCVRHPASGTQDAACPIALGKPINYFYEPFPAAPEVRDLEHAKIGLLKREAKKLVDSLVRADDLETAIQILAALGPSRP